jgi:16S rRNA pseudouridine516 synthase
MRLDKFICKSTNLTRAEAREVISSGRVQINGWYDCHEATQVHENNVITLDGVIQQARPSRYLMLHKPAGFVSSNVSGRYPSLFDNLATDNLSIANSAIDNGNSLDLLDVENLHIAGLLDADTTGLVLITDDGRWSFNVISPKSECEKVYRVTLRDPITEDAIKQLVNGVLLRGREELTLPAKLTVVSEKEVLLTITEGKYHQVKRMFGAVRNKVVALHREQIGPLKLDVPLGQWRYLTEDEVDYFYDE